MGCGLPLRGPHFPFSMTPAMHMRPPSASGFMDRHIDESLLVYVARVSLLSVAPVLAIVAVAIWTKSYTLHAHDLVTNSRLWSINATVIMGFLDVVLFSPLVESGLLVIPLRLLRKLRAPDDLIAACCGIFWAFVHVSYIGTNLGFVAAWPFYIFTHVLMRFEKPSLDRGWLIASSVHALHNLAALVGSALLAGS